MCIKNCHLAIFDERREVIEKQKLGWLEIWNTRRTTEGKANWASKTKTSAKCGGLSYVWEQNNFVTDGKSNDATALRHA